MHHHHYQHHAPFTHMHTYIEHRVCIGWEVIRIDEFIDQLLTSDYACDIALPRLPKRWHLEDAKMLPPRIQFVDDDEEEEGEEVLEKEEGEEVYEEEEGEVKQLNEEKHDSAELAKSSLNEEEGSKVLVFVFLCVLAIMFSDPSPNDPLFFLPSFFSSLSFLN
jgi:hypothetical protein